MPATFLSDPPRTVAEERARRLTIADALRKAHPDGLIQPQVLRDRRVYYGGQGVWVDAMRTRALDARGVTVSILHTGLHYADDLTDDGIDYHYPRTKRQPGRDRAEILATKAAGEHRLPVFVISLPHPNSKYRIVRLGWVEGWVDDGEIFRISFAEESPEQLQDHDRSDDQPFTMFRPTARKRAQRSVTVRDDQGAFKLNVFHRYGTRCPLSGVTVPSMLEAAHVVPVAANGSDDARNGLPLNAALHRAFDADLFAIDPDTHEVVTRPGGPKLEDLGIVTANLLHLRKLPDHAALAWRYAEWLKKQA